MKLLLDTHVLLWGMSEPRRLSAAAKAALEMPSNDLFVSVATLWEIAIKSRKGQLETPDDLPQLIEESPDYRLLGITPEHVWRVRRLPRLHGDPFDHLLVAQALCEEMALVTHDGAMAQYGVTIVPA